jgi:hypothetical protein
LAPVRTLTPSASSPLAAVHRPRTTLSPVRTFRDWKRDQGVWFEDTRASERAARALARLEALDVPSERVARPGTRGGGEQKAATTPRDRGPDAGAAAGAAAPASALDAFVLSGPPTP